MFSFLLPTRKEKKNQAAKLGRVFSQPLVTSPGNNVMWHRSLFVKSVRQRRKHCRLFGARTARAVLSEQTTHCLCRNIVTCPVDGKSNFWYNWKEKRLLFPTIKLFCINLLQWITMADCFTRKFIYSNRAPNYKFKGAVMSSDPELGVLTRNQLQ